MVLGVKEEIDMELEVRRMRISRFGKSKPKAMDPVCYMKVDMEKPPGGNREYEGATYYFCGPGCNRAFQKEASSYPSSEKRIDA